jgi:hypothetical protein
MPSEGGTVSMDRQLKPMDPTCRAEQARWVVTA